MDYAIVACILGGINILLLVLLSVALYIRHYELCYRLTMPQQKIDVIYEKACECEIMLYNMTKKDKDNK